MNPRVFICYRSVASGGYAGRIHDNLEYAAIGVFMDVAGLQGGQRISQILGELAKCTTCLVVIGAGWAETVSAAGTRLHDRRDHVRREIETALKHDLHLVPVLLDGARMPNAETLPPSLRPLCDHVACVMRHSAWKADLQHLITCIRTPSTGPVAVAKADKRRETLLKLATEAKLDALKAALEKRDLRTRRSRLECAKALIDAEPEADPISLLTEAFDLERLRWLCGKRHLGISGAKRVLAERLFDDTLKRLG